MILFLKGIIIGIAKIIPGVSGAMLMVSFNLYDKMIEAITHFFDNEKDNFKFLLILFSGVILSIVLFSNIVRYFINRYYFVVMMLFVGLIVGGTYNYSKNIKYCFKNILIIVLVILLMMIISFLNRDSNYIVGGNYIDYIMFFIGGIIEVFSSIVPGISGTALYMLMGLYDNILMLFGNVFNFTFVINNIGLYISYGIGMVVSFMGCSLIISYLLKKYRNLFDTIILGLSISSIILLFLMAFKYSVSFIELIIGGILLFLGIMISYVLDK